MKGPVSAGGAFSVSLAQKDAARMGGKVSTLGTSLRSISIDSDAFREDQEKIENSVLFTVIINVN